MPNHKSKEKYEEDLIIHWSKGGNTTLDNLQVLYKHSHNNKK